MPQPMPSDRESQKEAPQELLAPGLYITSTPIGHARDITLRALDVLRSCDAIAAEDTRVTSRLLAIYGISKPLVSYNDHSAARERPRLLARLARREKIVLVSDAGTPLLSDPGYKLVLEAIEADVKIHAIPGASALLTALVLGGLPPDRFVFAGFLPAKSGERRRALAELTDLRATLVFYEAPHRLAESLGEMAAALGRRRGAVCRELTKLYEETRRADLAELAEFYAAAPAPRGEVTIVVGPPAESQPNFTQVDSLLEQALVFMPVRAAADLVAGALGMPRHALYDRALARKPKAMP